MPYYQDYHFTECPITFPHWTRGECLKVHHFMVRKAYELAKTSPFMEFGDYYNAGYLGYLQAISRMKWTIQNPNLTFVCTRILGAMKDQWSSWYGRKDTPKGLLKRGAEFSRLSLDTPVKEDCND